jgi:hypothetical protein
MGESDMSVKGYIDALVEKYKYRPLPQEVRGEARTLYNANLNGFSNTQKRSLTIIGEIIARKYDRIVVGDYGAYVEIDPSDMMVDLMVPTNQMWRLNDDYVKEKGLSIKYYWYEYLGRKVYRQVAPVKYADYKPGKYYISVLDFDQVR